MTERRKAPAPRAQAKIKQLETRLARVEADLERVRAKAARGGGLSRERLTAIEKVMSAHVARAQAGLKDSVNRLGRRLLSARSRGEARQGVKESLDRLARTLGDSHRKVTQEVSALTRGLRAGVKAGHAAYRGRRR
jgi:DNA repair exonuclease SbcCD ATPase subunit